MRGQILSSLKCPFWVKNRDRARPPRLQASVCGPPRYIITSCATINAHGYRVLLQSNKIISITKYNATTYSSKGMRSVSIVGKHQCTITSVLFIGNYVRQKICQLSLPAQRDAL